MVESIETHSVAGLMRRGDGVAERISFAIRVLDRVLRLPPRLQDDDELFRAE